MIHSTAATQHGDFLEAHYKYQNTVVERKADGSYLAKPVEQSYTFRTETKVPKLGLMLVGLGGNNGSTLVAGILANRLNLTWETRNGLQGANYYGSVMMSSTVKLGVDANGSEIHVPFNSLLPMVHPNDIVVGGWDISSMNLYDAMNRSAVLEYDLKRQLKDQMSQIVPLPGLYYPDFIAANQSERANNVYAGSKKENLDQIRADIKKFKADTGVQKVIVLWTANTERFSSLIAGVNDTADNLLKAVENNHEEVSPSTLYAMASILEGCAFINGSPQNTFVPGCTELATKHKVFIGGDDFKSGQTKMKSVLVDFLVNAGIKPVAISSYNHLGNNDGKNLSAPSQFRSKEISKSNVVDDMVSSNNILYKEGEHPDHVVVIKYIPSVGDSKRALDEYVSEIFLGGHNTISMHNTCEDSLLATPLIIDLAIVTELMTRITYKTGDMAEFDSFNSVLSILSYMLKAPIVPKGAPVVNALAKQRYAIENIFRACLGLYPQNEMQLEHRV